MDGRVLRYVITAVFIAVVVIGSSLLGGCQANLKRPANHDPDRGDNQVIVDEGPVLD